MVSNNYPSQENSIYAERIRQAHWGFNLELGFVGICSGITLVGCILFLTGQTSKGAYMTVGGLTSTAVGGCCMRLSRDANDRLDKLALKEPENQLSNLNDDLDIQNRENSSIENPNSNDLTDALENLEQTILSDVLKTSCINPEMLS